MSSMSASQWAEWQAYAAIEPFGQFREELRHGQQMALTCNMERDPKRKPQPYEPIDFMNFIEKPPPEPMNFEKIDREVFGL